MNFHLGATQKETFMLATNGCHVRLAAWHPQSRQPAVIPLWLELPPNTLTGQPIARARSHSSFNKLADARGELLATPPGLVYRNEAVPGFWFIPWGDVLPRVETAFTKLAAASAARPAPGNHRGRQLLHTYDANEDGKVSPSEFAVLFSGDSIRPDSRAT